MYGDFRGTRFTGADLAEWLEAETKEKNDPVEPLSVTPREALETEAAAQPGLPCSVTDYSALVIDFDAIFRKVPAIEQYRECLLGLLDGPLRLFGKDGKLRELAAVLARDDVGDVAVHLVVLLRPHSWGAAGRGPRSSGGDGALEAATLRGA